MKTKPFNHPKLLPFLLIAAIGASCGDAASSGTSSGDAPDMRSAGMDNDQQGGVQPDTLSNAYSSARANTDPATTTDNWNTTGGYDATGAPSATGGYNADGTKRVTVTILTPVQERAGAMETMNGIRSVLMAELEEVRSHLNKGTLPDAHAKADQERAAELAQGLERVDRALKAMGDATDVTWKDLRDVQLKEVAEVHAWWNEYMMGRAVSAKR